MYAQLARQDVTRSAQYNFFFHEGMYNVHDRSRITAVAVVRQQKTAVFVLPCKQIWH
jgi:hypothetical protein